MRVVAISGSARKDGSTAILVSHVFEELNAAGMEPELIQLGGRPRSARRRATGIS